MKRLLVVDSGDGFFGFDWHSKRSLKSLSQIRVESVSGVVIQHWHGEEAERYVIHLWQLPILFSPPSTSGYFSISNNTYYHVPSVLPIAKLHYVDYKIMLIMACMAKKVCFMATRKFNYLIEM